MAKEPKIYLGQVEGEQPGLYRSTDPRLVRRHILAGLFPPKIEVRVPGTEEAMNMALDGVVIVDVKDDEAGAGGPDPDAAAGDLLADQQGGDGPVADEAPAASPDDPGVDPERINPDDEDDTAAFDPPFIAPGADDDDCPI